MKFVSLKSSFLVSLTLVSFWTSAASISQQPLSSEDTAAILQAIEQTPPIPADQAPTSGTFYSATHGEAWPPFPGSMGLDFWELGSGIFLLNDLATDTTSSPFGAKSMSAMDLSPPDDGGTNYDGGDGGGYTNNNVTYAFDTNGLWLEITNVANGYASGNLHNPTNMVYAILSNTNLLCTNWGIEQEIWPGTNQQVVPFSVATLDRQILFLRAMDWTEVTENGNIIPDWWFWKYFGTVALSDANRDSQNHTLLSDYQNNTDPNIIKFSLSFTNQYANAFGMPMQVGVNSGTPFYVAVLVDDTNQANATWNTYTSSNITVDLGTNEGWHWVYVGLRGLPGDAQQTWHNASTRIKLDLTPPLLVITNPITSLATQPVIQLQGYCPEPLDSLSYDLSNDTGLVTNQQVLILDQYYDTNTLEFTTNYFQCFDVPLTTGTNIITFHATDLAGNITTTNFTYTLDYSSATNPPAIQLYWPQANTKISGSNFTWRGWVSDPTAQVSAQVVDENGITNSASGRVGREGGFWVDGVPLSGGTNNLTLTVTDSAGNTSVTNIPIVKSSLIVTVTSAGLGQAAQGTVSDPNYTIWVNGVKATNNGDGTWTAQDPHLTLDTPVLQVRAIPNSDNGGNGGGL